MLQRLVSIIVAALAAFLLVSCQQTGLSLPGSAPTESGQEIRERAEYRLGAADKIRIVVFGEQSLSGEFTVSGAGDVSFPLIGDVKASGLTISELQRAIEAKLAAGYLKNPRVSGEVLTFRPFYILGEVRRPGEYPFTNGLTVLNAVATAEGFTYRADTRRVFIKRANENSEREFALTTTTPVEPGDTIRIKERFF